MPGRGQRHLTDDAARSQHHDPLAGLQPGPPGEGHPGRDPRRTDGGRGGVRQLAVDRHQVGGGDGAQLGHAAVAGTHPGGGGEPDPAAGGELRRLSDDPDSLHTGHVRQRLLPEVGGAAGAEQVERHDGGGGHLDEVDRIDRLGSITQHGRGPVRVQERRPHVAMSGYGNERCCSAAPYARWYSSGP